MESFPDIQPVAVLCGSGVHRNCVAMHNATHSLKRKDTPHTYKTLADLAGFEIGVVEGYAYGESFYVASDFKQVSQGTVLQNLRSL